MLEPNLPLDSQDKDTQDSLPLHAPVSGKILADKRDDVTAVTCAAEPPPDTQDEASSSLSVLQRPTSMGAATALTGSFRPLCPAQIQRAAAEARWAEPLTQSVSAVEHDKPQSMAAPPPTTTPGKKKGGGKTSQSHMKAKGNIIKRRKRSKEASDGSQATSVAKLQRMPGQQLKASQAAMGATAQQPPTSPHGPAQVTQVADAVIRRAREANAEYEHAAAQAQETSAVASHITAPTSMLNPEGEELLHNPVAPAPAVVQAPGSGQMLPGEVGLRETSTSAPAEPSPVPEPKPKKRLQLTEARKAELREQLARNRPKAIQKRKENAEKRRLAKQADVRAPMPEPPSEKAPKKAKRGKQSKQLQKPALQSFAASVAARQLWPEALHGSHQLNKVASNTPSACPGPAAAPSLSPQLPLRAQVSNAVTTGDCSQPPALTTQPPRPSPLALATQPPQPSPPLNANRYRAKTQVGRRCSTSTNHYYGTRSQDSKKTRSRTKARRQSSNHMAKKKAKKASAKVKVLQKPPSPAQLNRSTTSREVSEAPARAEAPCTTHLADPDAATSPQWNLSSLHAALNDVQCRMARLGKAGVLRRSKVHTAAPGLLCDPSFPDFVVCVKNIISASDSTKLQW